MKSLHKAHGIKYYRIENKSELGPVLELQEACFEPCLRPSRKDVEKRLDLFPDGFFVAFEDKTPVGCSINLLAFDKFIPEKIKSLENGNMFFNYTEKTGDNFIYTNLAVIPEYRGHRTPFVTQQLILLTRSPIEKYNVKRLIAVLETPDGDYLTKRLDFKVVRRFDIPVNGKTCCVIVKTYDVSTPEKLDGFFEKVMERV